MNENSTNPNNQSINVNNITTSDPPLNYKANISSNDSYQIQPNDTNANDTTKNASVEQPSNNITVPIKNSS